MRIAIAAVFLLVTGAVLQPAKAEIERHHHEGDTRAGRRARPERENHTHCEYECHHRIDDSDDAPRESLR